MELIVRCRCGWEVRGTEDDVVAAATEHGRELHNMVPSRDEVLALAEPAPSRAPANPD